MVGEWAGGVMGVWGVMGRRGSEGEGERKCEEGEGERKRWGKRNGWGGEEEGRGEGVWVPLFF